MERTIGTLKENSKAEFINIGKLIQEKDEEEFIKKICKRTVKKMIEETNKVFDFYK